MTQALVRSIGISVGLILLFAAMCAPGVTNKLFQDLFIYRFGSHLGLEGQSPYDAVSLEREIQRQFPDDPELAEQSGFFLPPMAVVLLAPITLVSWPLAKWSWLIVSASAAAIGAWNLRVFDRTIATTLVPILVAGVLLHPVTIIGMGVGQTSLLSLSCVWLGEWADRKGWRWLGGLLWAVPFLKPHLALPLLLLAGYLGGWRRLAILGCWLGVLNLAGSLIAVGHPGLLTGYLQELSARHQVVIYNRVDFNPQITSWNRVLYAAGGPAIQLSAGTTLAGFGVWLLLVCARSWLARALPSRNGVFAAAGVGSVLCCQLLGYELLWLGLVVPFVVELFCSYRRSAGLWLLLLLSIQMIPYSMMYSVALQLNTLGQNTAAEYFLERLATIVVSYRSIGVVGTAIVLLVIGFRTDEPNPVNSP